MPWAVAGAAIGAGSAYYQGDRAESAAEDAADRTGRASEAAIERGQEAFADSEQQLAPWMGQERAASDQLMAQMGLSPQGGGGWGAGISSGGAEYQGDVDQWLDEVIANNIAYSQRSGHRRGERAGAEGARRTHDQLQQMKQNGQLPPDFELPSQDDLMQRGVDVVEAHGGGKNLVRNVGTDFGGRRGAEFNADAALGLMEGYNLNADRWAQPEIAGESGYMGAGGPGAGGPQVQTANDILERMGVEGLSPELEEQYMGEVMRQAESDPALAEYLGLTPESSSVGADYQQNPAYMRAMEQGREQVMQSGAGAGHLYSGRRGEEVARMGHTVEAGYYDRAQREHEGMLGRRFGQRGAEMGFMGTEVAGGRARQSDAYNNYMSMLMSASRPSTTTNVAQMRQNTALGEGSTLMGAAGDINQARMEGTAASNAAIGDIAGGIMEMGSAFIDRD